MLTIILKKYESDMHSEGINSRNFFPVENACSGFFFVRIICSRVNESCFFNQNRIFYSFQSVPVNLGETSGQAGEIP